MLTDGKIASYEADTSSRQGNRSLLPEPEISIRPFPFPYVAALAISSDLDGTRTATEYFDLIDFMNRDCHEDDDGLGLEFANSIYFAMPPSQFSYLGATNAEQARLRDYVHAGLVDTVHSFGGKARTRQDVRDILQEMDRQGLAIPVWTNHARVPTNMRELRGQRTGKGDCAGSAVYHARASRERGMRYVWRSQVTSLIGQNVRPDFLTPWLQNHPLRSGMTCLRQLGKSAAGLFSSSWSLHRSNRLCALASLEDGTEVVEFMRSNSHWAGISAGESAAGLAGALSDRVLSNLVRRGGASVFYTHLGKRVEGQNGPLPDSAIGALRRIAHLQRKGKVLVLTTARLLDLTCLNQWVKGVPVKRQNNRFAIELSLDAPEFIRERLTRFLPESGLTVYFSGPPPTEIIFEGQSLSGIKPNTKDASGLESVSLPLSRPAVPN